MDTPHLRIAVTTNSLIKLDANFVTARQMVFYDINRDEADFIDVIPFSKSGRRPPGGGMGRLTGTCVMDDMEDDDGTGHDPLTERIDSLKGCSILFTLGMSDLAAVRIHENQIFPVKSERVRDIDEVVTSVQRLMGSGAPLWLRRVMRAPDGNRLPLDDQEL
ncbi:NifB/NifX family molybdenum-iron cluster-binding protein [Pararhodospirillum oryzae]|uniref:Uncharacterized protein n=1 Tax=Pararhodospirillum oryzae TaxID=478448 RepID=A0A512H3J0_9PROT|nr:NifB/NifX family molybdenum-iron cluster-binding protein [Pararhodospirillum oryzae]GEO80024.1 hypothetical protein ROR02_01550 [Pararhodospirillum oryzae]